MTAKQATIIANDKGYGVCKDSTHPLLFFVYNELYDFTCATPSGIVQGIADIEADNE